MRSTQRAVKNALEDGGKVIYLGQREKGTAVLMRVSKPESWVSPIWENKTYLECKIGVGSVPSKIAWIRQNYPEAVIEMKDH